MMIGSPIAFPCLQYEYPFVVSKQQDEFTTLTTDFKNSTISATQSLLLSTVSALISPEEMTFLSENSTTFLNNITRTFHPLLATTKSNNSMQT